MFEAFEERSKGLATWLSAEGCERVPLHPPEKEFVAPVHPLEKFRFAPLPSIMKFYTPLKKILQRPTTGG